MSQYIVRLIENDLGWPTPDEDELKVRLRKLPPIPTRATGAELLDEARAEAGRD